MYYTKGGVGLEKLEEMPFDNFLLFLKEAERIQNLFLKDDING